MFVWKTFFLLRFFMYFSGVPEWVKWFGSFWVQSKLDLSAERYKRTDEMSVGFFSQFLDRDLVTLLEAGWVFVEDKVGSLFLDSQKNADSITGFRTWAIFFIRLVRAIDLFFIFL